MDDPVFTREKTETEREEQKISDRASVEVAQKRSAEFWRSRNLATAELVSSTERHLQDQQIDMGKMSVEHIDELKSTELLNFEVQVERFNRAIQELWEGARSEAERKDWKDYQDRLVKDYAPVARKRIEGFYDQYRADVIDGIHTPLWKRQKLWAVVFGTFFAGAAGTATLIMAITRATLDPNAQRAAARQRLLERQYKLDPELTKRLLDAASRLNLSLQANAFTSYLPWLKSVVVQFELGLLTMRDLMLDFSVQVPTHAPVGTATTGLPFTQEELDTLEQAIVDKYTSTKPHKYEVVFTELIAQATTTPDIQQLTAAQLNYILVGVLSELRVRFEDGTADPPGAP